MNFTAKLLPEVKETFVGSKAGFKKSAAELRILEIKLNEKIKTLREKFNTDNVELLERVASQKENTTRLEKILRGLMIRFRRFTKNESYDENVSSYTQEYFVYDEQKAFEFALRNKIKSALTLNKTGFEAYLGGENLKLKKFSFVKRMERVIARLIKI